MIPLIDLHQDIAGARAVEMLSKQTGFDQFKSANVKIVLGTGFVLPGEDFSEVIGRDFSLYEKQCADDVQWKMIKTKHDAEEVMTDGHGVIFHIEGFHGFSGEYALLEKWYARGWRSTGLVWNTDNIFGGGTNSNKGLTDAGRAFIAWCEERDILIDFSHMNRVMFDDCLGAITKPPFISHGGLDALAPNSRNFTDAHVRTIAARGGVFGIFFPKSAMAKGEAFTAEDISTHIIRAVDIAGEDCVALGTDFGGMTSGTPLDIPNISEVGRLWDVLAAKGCSPALIEKIAFRNAQKYLESNLPE